MTTHALLIAQKLTELRHAVALRRTKWSACNPMGQHLIQFAIDRLTHDLDRLGAGEQARRIV